MPESVQIIIFLLLLCKFIYSERKAFCKPHLFDFQVQLCFPEEGLVYDYHLDDAGINHFDDEEEGKERKVRECFLEHLN